MTDLAAQLKNASMRMDPHSLRLGNLMMRLAECIAYPIPSVQQKQPFGQLPAMTLWVEYMRLKLLTKDTYSSSDTRTYDAENRLTINTNGANQVSRYTYDGSGARVRRLMNGIEVWQVYGMDDELLAEYAAGSAPSSAQKEYGYRNKELLVTATNTADVEWLVCDQLGTPRLVADKIGNLAGVKRHDYLPFGEEIGQSLGGRTALQGYVAHSVRQQFTGKERDQETGLDYFGARYFSSTQGRFTNPDKPFADQDPIYPQSWNLYNYVRNNPLKYIDEFGEEITYASPELEQISNNLRAESPTYDEALKGFEGEGAPDLTVQMGDAGLDANGRDEAPGLTVTNILPEVPADPSLGIEPLPAELKDATITIDDSIKGDQKKLEDVLAHEVGHADDARKEPGRYDKDSSKTKQEQGATKHDKRSQEKRADEFRDKVKKERDAAKKQREAEEKQRKKKEKERKKLEREQQKKAKQKKS
jgi:RHS repeat-associated protein